MLLDQGLVREANPVMDQLMRLDIQLFINVKAAVTGGCLLLLVTYARARLFGVVTTAHCLYAIAGFYMLLVSYEILFGLAFGAFSF